MNLKYNKALYLLDMGRYEEAEQNLRMAIEECKNPFELAQIYGCYALFLYDEKRFEETMECVDYILTNTSKYDDNDARDTAIEIKEKIEKRKKRGIKSYLKNICKGFNK